MLLTAAQRAIACKVWPAKPIPTTPYSADAILFGGACLLRGWSIEDGNASSADVVFYDGQDVNGTTAAYTHLATGGNSAQWFGAPSIYLEIGLFMHATNFPIRGAVYVTALDDLELAKLFAHEEKRQAGKPYGQGG